MFNKTIASLIISSALLLGVSSAAQARITDATGDILATYTGVQGGDLDVVSSDVVFDGTGYNITATFAGAVGTTPGAFYVWGFDRGGATSGTAPFASVGADQVFFNSVVILRPDTTAQVNRLNGGGTTVFGAGTSLISGNTISARIAASELPSTGFAASNYTWNLWPRVGAGNNNQISDFAPNNGLAAVTVVPEAGSLMLLAPALLGAVGIVVVRRRHNTN